MGGNKSEAERNQTGVQLCGVSGVTLQGRDTPNEGEYFKTMFQPQLLTSTAENQGPGSRIHLLVYLPAPEGEAKDITCKSLRLGAGRSLADRVGPHEGQQCPQLCGGLQASLRAAGLHCQLLSVNWGLKIRETRKHQAPLTSTYKHEPGVKCRLERKKEQ